MHSGGLHLGGTFSEVELWSMVINGGASRPRGLEGADVGAAALVGMTLYASKRKRFGMTFRWFPEGASTRELTQFDRNEVLMNNIANPAESVQKKRQRCGCAEVTLFGGLHEACPKQLGEDSCDDLSHVEAATWLR